MSMTAAELVRAISELSRSRDYPYVDPKNRGRIVIKNITQPEGPIKVGRYNPSNGDATRNAKKAKNSTQLIWRVANAISEGVPLQIDRVVGASYNTRSVLEALLAHTPQF